MLKRSLLRTAEMGRYQLGIRCISTSKIPNNSLAPSSQTQHSISWENAKPMQDIPSPPKQLFMGNISVLLKNMRRQHKIHEEMRKKYGNMIHLSGLGQNIVCLYGPEEGSAMYANDGKYPVIGGFENFEFLRERRKDIYPSPGVLCQGEEWRKNRSAVQQDMMRAKSAMYYLDDVQQIVEELLEVFEETKDSKDTLDVYPLLKLWSLEAISWIFLSKRLYCFSTDSAKRTPDAEAMVKAAERSNTSNLKLFTMIKLWKYVPNLIPAYRMFEEANETINRISKAKVDAAMEKIDLENECEQSILAKFARRNGKDSPLNSIMAQDAMFAGIDTTGSTSTFALYHLASNPEKQEILYKEICEVIGDKFQSITESKLNKMKYLKACLHESQRLLPAAVGSSRVAQDDYVICGYQIPKGTLVINYNQIASNCSENFENPEKYLPERWLRSNPESKSAHPFSSIPFGHGARSCIGRRFAQLELHCLMIKVLQNYRLEYHGEPVDLITEFLSIPDREVKIQFRNRK